METRKLILNALFCLLFLITGEVVAADITSLGVTPSAEKDNTLAIQTVSLLICCYLVVYATIFSLERFTTDIISSSFAASTFSFSKGFR